MKLFVAQGKGAFDGLKLKKMTKKLFGQKSSS
jgi:hypothetical protein